MNRAVFNDIVNEMEPNIDVFGVSMILVILCECDGRLVVQQEGGRVEFARENLGEEGTKLKHFFCHMSHGNILALSGREGDDLLPFSAPRNGSPMKHQSIPGNCMPILSHAPIRICIINQFILHHAIT